VHRLELTSIGLKSGLALAMALPLCVAGLAACGPKAAPKEAEPCDRQVVSVGIIATPHINPEENGEPRPVQVRIYQLKTDVLFRNSSFEQIWKADEEKLGKDLLAKQEFPVFPDSRKAVEFERNPEAEFIAVAGLFRTPKGKQWFTSFELPPPPGEESCGAKCADGECEKPPELNPKIYVRVDGTRVEDGSAYAEEFQVQSARGMSSGGAL
jgi:type VI secretion system protein VasD